MVKNRSKRLFTVSKKDFYKGLMTDCTSVLKMLILIQLFFRFETRTVKVYHYSFQSVALGVQRDNRSPFA